MGMVDETVLEGLSTKDHFFLKILEIRIQNVREFFSTRFEGDTLAKVDKQLHVLRAFAVAELYEDKSKIEELMALATPPAAADPIEEPKPIESGAI